MLYFFPLSQIVYFHFQTGLANYYVDVLNIAKESEDGRKLLNYRAPSSVKHVCILIDVFPLRRKTEISL